MEPPSSSTNVTTGAAASTAAVIEDLEWEEWDSSTSPLSFGHHCLAGSFAGVMEHTLLYPLDTVKTCWQSQVLHKASGKPGCSPCEMAPFVNSSVPNSTASASGLQNLKGSFMMHNREHNSHPKTHRNRLGSKQSRMVRNATAADLAPSLTSSQFVSDTITSKANPVTNVSSSGVQRLFRGVQSIFIGCIPAHALYFSSYEIVKTLSLEYNKANTSSSSLAASHHSHGTITAYQAMAAGGIATFFHDLVMTPMDTMKQRMQLGHYNNLRHAFKSIVWGEVTDSAAATRATGEGWKGLYRSFPVTLLTNVPYGMIMMSTNEWLRGVLEDGLYGVQRHHHSGDDNDHYERRYHFTTILLSGMGAGAFAAALTAPLDRVKTRLQTQRMGMVLPPSVNGGGTAIIEERALAAALGEPKTCPRMAIQDVKRTLFPSSVANGPVTLTASSSTAVSPGGIPLKPPSSMQTPFSKTYYTTPFEAFQSILHEEGYVGLFRGTLPRVALHAPSVAISWTAYEMAKGWLVWLVED
ncbi:hypothetical protein HJC23_000822 [Cyclotella cryptica]|uniref:Mitochondrial carrier protein n=1 Tax=Cyclotella cryptica TaxID=29204 RepID=A0ABD3Q6G6_9STRA